MYDHCFDSYATRYSYSYVSYQLSRASCEESFDVARAGMKNFVYNFFFCDFVFFTGEK